MCLTATEGSSVLTVFINFDGDLFRLPKECVVTSCAEETLRNIRHSRRRTAPEKHNGIVAPTQDRRPDSVERGFVTERSFWRNADAR